MDFHEKKILGRTGLGIGRLGIASSYGAPAAAFEEAFEKGCNYFTWGSFLRGRSKEMRKAITNIIAKGQRDNLVLAIYSYTHNRYLTDVSIPKGLKALGIDYADILILGYYHRQPGKRNLEGAIKLKEKGIVRHIGLSGHNRKLFPVLNEQGIMDVFHIRYNAVNRGAEVDAFPYISGEDRPCIVSFTATCWGRLLKQKKMPPGETAPGAVDCYRFVLTHPSVDICMTGARNMEQMRENLKTLDQGPMNEEELARMRKIGDYIYRKR